MASAASHSSQDLTGLHSDRPPKIIAAWASDDPELRVNQSHSQIVLTPFSGG